MAIALSGNEADRRGLVDPATGRWFDVPDRLALVEASRADPSGWRAIVSNGSVGSHAFLHVASGELRHLDVPDRHWSLWGACFVALAQLAVEGHAVRVHCADGSTVYPLPDAVAPDMVRVVEPDMAVVFQRSVPHAVIDLGRGVLHELPTEVFSSPASWMEIKSVANGDWYVVAQEATPLLRLDRRNGRIEEVASLLPPDAAAFDSGTCSRSPVLLDDGRLVLGLHRAEGLSGAYMEGQDGRWQLLGRPLHDVLVVSIRGTERAFVVRGHGGEPTSCLREYTWDRTPDGNALTGDSLQVVWPGGRARSLDPTRPSRDPTPYIDASGTCLVRFDWQSLTLLDVVSERTVNIEEFVGVPVARPIDR